MRITPPIITLKPNEILVYPSNLEGINGKGLALLAKEKFGAKNGIGFGFNGQCFAIPTRKVVRYRPKIMLETLTLMEIEHYVGLFYEIVKNTPDKHFLITKIGCGNAGYEPSQVKFMFEKFKELDNISLPQEFI